MDETKHCPKCGTFKHLEQFYSNISEKGGLSCWCKECCKSYINGRYNAVKTSEYKKKYYHENKKKYLVKGRKMREKWNPNPQKGVETKTGNELEEIARDVVLPQLEFSNITRFADITHHYLGTKYSRLPFDIIATRNTNTWFIDVTGAIAKTIDVNVWNAFLDTNIRGAVLFIKPTKAFFVFKEIQKDQKNYRVTVKEIELSQHPSDVVIEEINKLSRRTKDGKPMRPPLPESEILGALDKVLVDLGTTEFKNVRIAMPMFVKYVGMESRKHNCRKPKGTLFTFYKAKLEEME